MYLWSAYTFLLYSRCGTTGFLKILSDQPRAKHLRRRIAGFELVIQYYLPNYIQINKFAVLFSTTNSPQDKTLEYQQLITALLTHKVTGKNVEDCGI